MNKVEFEIKYVDGPTINNCYFVGIQKTASGEENKWPVRASWLLDPKLHAIANADDDKESPKLEVQPEDVIAEISKTATDLESFKATTARMAVAIHGAEGVAVKATEEGPVWSVEDQEKGKVTKEPVVSMEGGSLSEGKVPTTGGSKVASFYARLPKKSIGAPQIALDMQSKVTALEEQLKVVQAEKEAVEKERDDAKQEAGTMKKSGESDAVLKLLEKMGIVEDDKDKEEFKGKLSKLDSSALKVLEEILKSMDGGGKSEEKPKVGGAPAGFPPKKPEGPKPPAKPGGAEGIFSSDDNVIQGSLSTELDALAEISRRWIAEDRRKAGKR